MQFRWKFGCLRLIIATVTSSAALASPAAEVDATTAAPQIGPIRLTAPGAPQQNTPLTAEQAAHWDARDAAANPTRPAASEFESYVSSLAGLDVRRLGSDLMLGSRSTSTLEANRQVPPDYVIGTGDEVQITMWGTIDSDMRLTVDRTGRINIPRVGPVVVAGVRLADLTDLLTRRVGQVFKNFQLSAALGRLRSIRYYVTGFTSRPGAYTASSLATLMTGLSQAGGPSGAGSFRNIELRRNGKVVSRFDLYDLLVKGDKSADVPLQADDVLHVGPVGALVGVLGSVNTPAVIELKGEETISDALAIVGGQSAVADRTRISIERLSERNDRRVVELPLPNQSGQRLVNGDVLRVFSGVGVTLPQVKQYKRVRVEGEVAHPGDYVLPPLSTLKDAVQAAGGMTSAAYVFGTDFSRESVRRTQEENYDRALRDLETELTRSTSTQKSVNADDALAQAQRSAGASRLIERLRTVRPTGRIVLQVNEGTLEVPAIIVEDGDRLLIPARPSTVGVFGSVFNGGSYLIRESSTIEDILKLAGGPTRGADVGSIFVVRANGSVVSARQSSGSWLSLNGGMTNVAALPGDTIFVPEELNKTTFSQEAKEWTQILYQFGLGAAALKTLKN